MPLIDFKALDETSNKLGEISSMNDSVDLTDLLNSKSLADSSNEQPTTSYYLYPYNSDKLKDTSNMWLPTIQTVDRIPVPHAIRSLYSQVECEMFMGLFPEINRAWITIDNKLFLWNFCKGEQFYMYNGLDQLIVSVGLARPIPDMFPPEVEYLVVVSTPVEIVILELWFLDDDPLGGPIELRPTEFNVASDDVPMRCIVGTLDGHIFMGGHDGNLYELIYEPVTLMHSLGLKRQCRKVKCSGSTASWLVPAVLRSQFSKSEPIHLMAVDHERKLLYTLSGNRRLSCYNIVGNSIHLYGEKDIGNDNQVRIVSLQVISKQESKSEAISVVCISDRGVRYYLSHKFKMFRNVVSRERLMDDTDGAGGANEATIRMSGEKTKELVSEAFYSDGVTLLGTSSVDSMMMGDTLNSYTYDSSMRNRSAAKNLKWERSNFHEIVDLDVLATGPSLKNGVISDQRSLNWGLPVGKIWKIAEVAMDPTVSTEEERVYSNSFYVPPSLSSQSRMSTNQQNKRPVPGSGLDKREEEPLEYSMISDLARQHILPRRYFLVLTAQGAWKLAKNQPINQLYSLFERNAPEDHFREFFRLFGLYESCAMCLNIACTTGEVVHNDDFAYNSKSISDAAVRCLVKLDHAIIDEKSTISLPCAQTDLSTKDPPKDTKSGSVTAQKAPGQDIVSSGFFCGLQLYVSRLFTRFWNWPIIVLEQDDLGQYSYRCQWSRFQIEILKSPLANLKDFLKKTSPFSDRISENWHGSVGQKSQSVKFSENEKLYRLYQLIDRTIQSLWFFDIVQSSSTVRLHDLVTGMEYQKDDKIFCSEMSWREFVCTIDGHVMASALVKDLVAKDPHGDIVSRLHDQCPSYFSPGDSDQLGALQNLVSVSSQPIEHTSALKESISTFQKGFESSLRSFVVDNVIEKKFADNLIRMLKEASSRIRDPADSLELVLGCAYITSREIASASKTGDCCNIEDVRDQCYLMAINLLETVIRGHADYSDEVKRTMKVATASEDARWHEQLYSWLLCTGQKNLLMAVKSVYIERFLSSDRTNVYENTDKRVFYGELAIPPHENIHKLILAEWYDTNEKSANAANVMYDLASQGTNSSLKSNPNLDQRIYYLQQAIIYSQMGENEGLLQFELADIRDGVEMAKLQRNIMKALQQRLGGTQDEEIEKAISSLNAMIVEPSELYNEYAYRYHLWEFCAELMYLCEHDDEEELHSLFAKMFQQAYENRKEESVSEVRGIMRNKLSELCRKFKGKGKIFPLGYIIRGLEDAVTFFPSDSDRWDSWIVSTLFQEQVPVRDVFFGYTSMAEIMLHGAALHINPLSKMFLTGEVDDSSTYEDISKICVANAIIHIINKWSETQGDSDDFALSSKKAIEILERLVDQVRKTRNDLQASVKELRDKLPDTRSFVFGTGNLYLR